MGEVYLGEKIGPEGFVKPVVLKLVLPQLAKDRAFVQLFLDEARLAALLNHPNIAQIYDFGEEEGSYFMAMEYVPGYTVEDVRRKHESIDRDMPIEHVACIASQACQGLHYAHALTDARNVGLGLVHRDVSPHNLIVSVDGGVKIVDFGIAKARAGLTRVQARGAVGKFGYMSPEQARGETVDARTDVFSLGVCIWELLCRRRLHDPKLDRPPEYRRDRPLPSASAFRHDVPKQLDQLLRRAMSIDPDARFESAQEMHLEIERFLAAMTHYAGANALAQYIKELVEGKIESQPQRTGGGVVEPATVVSGAPRLGPGEVGTPGGLEAAQRYEEVFGTNLELAEAPAASVPRAVPESWKTQAPAPAPPSARPGPTPTPRPSPRRGPPHLSDDAPALELARPTARAAAPTPRAPRTSVVPGREERIQRASMAPPVRRSRGPIVGSLLLLLCVALGVAGFLERDRILAEIEARSGGSEGPTLGARYRIVSEPAGAAIEIDGKRRGQTPLELDLLPGVPTIVALSLDGHATERLQLDPKVAPGVQELRLALSAQHGTLRLSSSPSGAEVAIDGVPLRGVSTPATVRALPVGRTLRVTVRAEGLAPVSQDVELGARETRKLHFNLAGR